MIVVARFTVEPDQADRFRADAATALRVLAERPGFVGGRLARAIDDGSTWLLVTEWEGVGAYRRALGGYDVKLAANPLLARSWDEPTAYEVLLDTETGESASDATH
jgi:quinol monooxygenase YgiN